MNQRKFWKIIDKCRYAQDPELRLDQLLDRLTTPEIRDFDWIFQTFEHYANRMDVYGAAHLLGQASDDDEFMDFIRGLILSGRHVFEAALGEPDTLRCLWLRDPIANEGIALVARKVYARKSGISIFEAIDELIGSIEKMDIELTIYGTPYEPSEGDRWDFDNEQENRLHLPKLSHAVYDHRYGMNQHG